ncbi:thiolase family protein [Staphylococcus gallinarum]|jgi:acetyl-CoA C-acetyltransferase|uniref:Probable acetyl-CoA acyltransferase n=1 Tax=Staphylococcus gallinarum TaxID=1293 RepID=A0ABQ0Y3K4_STAGA|nr:thiolase family protein [Staphylococcus gallinarum]KIR10073.1 3-ketoacyl-CoA thiolase [Staphylococcus gallinarum]MBU7217744.1 thiolase family protein [Staphylococcus gallinarum]MCD8785258.1 thiolase family protein [Staphylococcus gallinarum]MCD8792467.1 thiolase family protein [Staphylococcus gallinarum]MCD8829375.1 thiolase family protein [Staphylococcus gallinarum]
MNNIAIVSAKRTPIGRYKGKLSNYSAVELGTKTLEAAMKAVEINPEIVDQVIYGNVLQSGSGQNPARQISINAGIPNTVPAMTINEVCGSGLKSIILGKQLIQLGEAKVVAVGGVESMTNAPKLILNDDETPVASFMHDGLTDAFMDVPMGITAEKIAEKYDVTREQQDAFANESQRKAHEATLSGKFDNEIVPLKDIDGEWMTTDEGIRGNSSIEKLATLKTIFKEDGTVTGGNASSINDGASTVILMDADYAKQEGFEILAYVGEHAEIGCDPEFMGYAPYHAVTQLLNKADRDIDEVDIVEMTEAFAAQSIPVTKNLNIPEEKLNLYGGAIALGHPIGASGTRLVTTLVNALAQEQKQTGVATACIGGGLGIAMLIEKGDK